MNKNDNRKQEGREDQRSSSDHASGAFEMPTARLKSKNTEYAGRTSDKEKDSGRH